MTNNAGWMQRVFGVRQPDEQPEGERADLAEFQRVRAELLEEIKRWRSSAENTAGELERMRTRASESDSALRDASAQIAALQGNLTEAATKLEEQEGALRYERERADALGKSASAANRRADKRLTEIDASQKRIADLESRIDAVTDDRVALELTLAALEGELASARQEAALAHEDLLRLREQAGQRETDAARWRARASELEEELARKQHTERERERQFDELKRNNAQLHQTLQLAEAEMRWRGRALVDIVRVSARALDMASGNGLSLALELAHLRHPLVTLPTVKAVVAAEQSVAQLLAKLGIAATFEVEEEGATQFRCRLALSSELATEDSSQFGCWVAAYATAALGSVLGRKLCLGALAGGPREFAFQAIERHP